MEANREVSQVILSPDRAAQASVDTPNPANDRQLKTGHRGAAGTGVQ